MRNIEAKMAAFTDAGLYEQDSHIDFEAEEHIYLYDGSRQLLPVSSLIAYFFEPFDAQSLWSMRGSSSSASSATTTSIPIVRSGLSMIWR